MSEGIVPSDWGRARQKNNMMKLDVLQSFEDPDTCSSCGGKCCQTMPGSYLPEDFGNNPRTVISRLGDAIKTGRVAIDWWEGDPLGSDAPGSALYARPATKGMEGEVKDGSFGGVCTHFQPTGCEIFDRRPTGCRGLKPNPKRGQPGERCVYEHSDKQDAAIAWLPYQAALNTLISELEEGW